MKIEYKVEGIGEDFLARTTDLSIVDTMVQVTDCESFLMTRRLVREEGMFCGGASKVLPNSTFMPIDWSSFAQAWRGKRLVLPTYPFQRQQYWVAPRFVCNLFYETTLRSGSCHNVCPLQATHQFNSFRL